MNRSTEFSGTADVIPFARPFLDDREEEAVLRVLRSGWLTTAGETLSFEREFAEATGASHAIAVSSGTAGLHLALESLGVGPGSRVITTPYTFTSTAEVARYLGADPLFVDIGDDLNIDPDQVESAASVNDDISAIVPVHVGGQPCDLSRLNETSERHGIPLVEDAAHAFPGTYRGKALGRHGVIGVYSFYATKTLTTGEGGMIVTDDSDHARRMTVMRLHGIDREVWDRYTSTRPSWLYEIVEAGFKYNLPDILAAIGRVQLRKSAEMLGHRRRIAGIYREMLSDRDYLELPSASSESSWHLYVIRIRLSALRISRDEFIAKLAERGIGTSVHYIPLHLMPYYRDRYGLRPDDFPRALAAYQSAISLPIYPGLGDEAVHRVARDVLAIGDASVVRT